MDIPLYVSDPQISIFSVLLRLLCALIVGAVIGTEREYTHRPAGMRTHMLVSLGSCVVMLLGQLIFLQYRNYGASPDPARMAAQVITGVGFLGAGTILREGPTVKGLTTAASLWATACLGLAAGGGYYLVALAGMVFIFITLTIFEIIQKKLIGEHTATQTYEVRTENIPACLEAMNEAAAATNTNIHHIHGMHQSGSQYAVRFQADHTGGRRSKGKEQFLSRLLCAQGILSVQTCADQTEKI